MFAVVQALIQARFMFCWKTLKDGCFDHQRDLCSVCVRPFIGRALLFGFGFRFCRRVVVRSVLIECAGAVGRSVGLSVLIEDAMAVRRSNAMTGARRRCSRSSCVKRDED